MQTTPYESSGGAVFTLLILALASGACYAGGYGGPYGFGRAATAQEIADWDIDARPDGAGLPPGSGTYAQGRDIYAQKCAACHGANLEGVKATGGNPLKGGIGSLTSENPVKTVGSYWPYATTLFDFTKRAMPFNAPGSLSDDEVYALAAFVLVENGIVSKDQAMTAKTLPEVQMPNRDGFIPDSRPDVFNY